MGSLFRRFLTDTSAASAIEYGLIAGMIACVVIGAMQNIGIRLSGKFGKVTNALS